MVFSSTLFLFLFLPLVLAAYYVAPSRARNAVLSLFSMAFYAWGGTWFLAVMMATIVFDYCWGFLIANPNWRTWRQPVLQLDPNGPRTRVQKLFVTLSITGNLSLLAFFKYFNFGIDSYNSLVASLGLDSCQWETTLRVVLPIGISFFTFQSMSYTIDVYTGHTRVTRNVLNYTAFATMFPQLIAGPIVRYRDIVDQLVHRRHTLSGFAYGVRRFVIGLAKKVIIANTVAVAADAIFGLPTAQLTCSVAWLGLVCYTLQLYFDFSGYSDMAIGLGHMFGFTFMENFKYPYISKSIKEFWRRWHISLSSWFRDYLYIPLGGNRKSPLRTHLNLVLVFFLCGLWHGASWTFVIWGLYHGVFLVFERIGFGHFLEKLPNAFRHGYALLVVMVGWVFFRSDTFAHALGYVQAMVGFGHGDGLQQRATFYLTLELNSVIVIGLIGATPLAASVWSRFKRLQESSEGIRRRVLDGALAAGSFAYTVTMLFMCSALLAGQTYNPFIYFRF